MHELNLPLTAEDIAGLSAYDQVLLTGTLYVGRDQVHSLLYERLLHNESLR